MLRYLPKLGVRLSRQELSYLLLRDDFHAELAEIYVLLVYFLVYNSYLYDCERFRPRPVTLSPSRNITSSLQTCTYLQVSHFVIYATSRIIRRLVLYVSVVCQESN